jgi:HSP20 family protein
MAEWNPWTQMEQMRRELDRAFDNFARRGREPFSRVAFLPGRAARQYPMVNVHDRGDTIKVEALAPGLDPESLEVSVMRNTLHIAGEKRRLMADIQPEAFHRRERATGKFVRTIELPTEIDESKVSADYINGLLVIALPKVAQAKPKQISVSVN